MEEKYKCDGCGIDLRISELQENGYSLQEEVYFGKCPKCGFYNQIKAKKNLLETDCSYILISQ